MTVAGLTRDDWLSARLGKPAWRLAASADAAAWRADLKAPAFVDCRAAVSDGARRAALLAAGFNLIDTTVTLERPSGHPIAASNAGVRHATSADASRVAAIAKNNFSTDRFHADPKIPQATADRIKADWAANFFQGARGDWMVVAEVDDEVMGFLQLLDRPQAVVIDLIAVDQRARRRGLAAAMIAYAGATLKPEAGLKVGTQLANVPSLQLYENLGFRVESAEHVFHHHVD